MRKIFSKRIFVLIIAVLAAFVLFGCLPGGEEGGGTEITKLEIINPEDASFILGNVDISVIGIRITKSNGTSETLSLATSMLSQSDMQKLKSIGTKTLTVTYGGRSAVLTVEIKQTVTDTFYNAYFDSNGGSTVSPIVNVKTITAFTNPIRAGFTFLGWFNNVDLMGSAVVAPYTLTEETTFYAKWEDNRKWTVRFIGDDGNPISAWTQTVSHGSNVPFIPPEGPQVEGKTFVRWTGQTTSIINNTDIHSEYTVISFNIEYIQNYGEAGEVVYTSRVSYGTSLPATERRTVLEREGYTAKWLILYDSGLTEPLVSSMLDNVKQNIKIISKYDINTFRVLFVDDPAYASSPDYWESKSPLTVNYNSTIDFSLQQYSAFSSPAARRGTTSSWSAFTAVNSDNLTDEKYRNFNNGYLWDAAVSEWSAQVSAAVFNIYNRSGDIIAEINNGKIMNIKADLTIYAKYVKNKYDIVFTYESAAGGSLTTMNYTMRDVKYGTKIALYTVDGSEMLPDVSYDGAKNKTEFLRYPYPNDWNVKWYSVQQPMPDDVEYFSSVPYITVDDVTHHFFGLTVDKRLYKVRFYDWNFETNSPQLLSVAVTGSSGMQYLSEQMLPVNGTPIFPVVTSKVTYGYDFIYSDNYWFDAPQNAGYGTRFGSDIQVKYDIDLYVRYKPREFNVYFRDDMVPVTNANISAFNLLSPQPTYVFIAGSETKGVIKYAQMNALYKRAYNHVFNTSEIYFGGDEIYGKVTLVESYRADAAKFNLLTMANPGGMTAKEYLKTYYNSVYKFIIRKYNFDGATLTVTENDSDWPEALTNAMLLKDMFEYALVKIGDINLIVPGNSAKGIINLMMSFPENRISYRYTAEEKAVYDYVAAENRYSSLRALHAEINGIYKFIVDYMGSRKAEYDAVTDAGGINLYDEYIKLLYRVDENARTEFDFSGFYLNSTFTSASAITLSASGEFNSDVPAMNGGLKNNAVVYAQWIDKDLGSLGLVFELIRESNPDYEPLDPLSEEYIYYYKVIDFVNSSTNTRYIIESGSGENAVYYYINQNNMRVSGVSITPMPDAASAMDTVVRIPSTHLGIPVTYIAKTLFSARHYVPYSTQGTGAETEHHGGVRGIVIPFSIKFIEEGTFSGVGGFGVDTVQVDEKSQYYASKDKVIYGIEIDAQTQILRTLLAYPSHLVRSGTEVFGGLPLPADMYVIPDTVTRISNYAFNSTLLKRIAFVPGFLPLAIGMRAFYGNGRLESVGSLSYAGGSLSSNNDIPARVTSIGDEAFAQCSSLMTIGIESMSRLKYVGRDILVYTGWYYNRPNGAIITLGHVILGVKGSLDWATFNYIDIGSGSLLFDKITVIADYAFYNKSEIEYLVIRASVINIGISAFDSTALSIVDVSLLGSPDNCEVGEQAFYGVSSSFQILVHPDYYADYKVSANGWSDYADNIKDKH